MLIYAILTILAVLAAAVCVWIYRSVFATGQSGYRRLSARQRNRRGARLAHLNSNLGTAPSPWGWGQASGATVSGRLFADGHGHNPLVNKTRKEFNDARGSRLQRTELELVMSGAKDQGQLRSVRNVLTGYDLQKKNPVTDTSCWPYRDDNFGKASLTASSIPTIPGASGAPEKPQDGKDDPATLTRKPWGW